MKCRICSGPAQLAFVATVRDRFKGRFFQCEECGFLQVEKADWLEEAYASAINLSDTGLVARNLHLSRVAGTIIGLLFDRHGLFIDYPGGYGLLTRLMRDMGFDFYWLDPFAENFLTRGFEYGDSQRKPNVVTAFEVFEHLFDPLQEIEKIVKLSPNILFSTELLPIPTPKPLQWWYYGLEHGQHVSFYRKETLTRIAAKFGLRFYSSGFINLFSDCVNFPSSVSYFTKVLRKFDRSFLLAPDLSYERLNQILGRLLEDLTFFLEECSPEDSLRKQILTRFF